MKGVKRVVNRVKARGLEDGMVMEERRLARPERRAHARQQWKPRLSRVEMTEAPMGRLESVSLT